MQGQEDFSALKLGIAGVILMVAIKAVHMLWVYGEDKAKAAAKERDDLRTERAQLREQCAAEKAALILSHVTEKAAMQQAHEQELARVRLEAEQRIQAALAQVGEVRAAMFGKVESLLIVVTKLTSSLEPMLAKLYDKVSQSGSKD